MATVNRTVPCDAGLARSPALGSPILLLSVVVRRLPDEPAEEATMSDHPNPVHVLHPEESWGFLRTHEFGRLAFHLVSEVHIAPINYALDGERIVFLTAEGSKLFGVTANPDVAFEVDEIVGERATSVIVREADEISGRRFGLTRPWLRDLPTG